MLKSHGIKRKKNKHWEYNIKEFGFNYRLSDINCALGLRQLSKIKKFINYRHQIYKNYQKFLSKNIQIIVGARFYTYISTLHYVMEAIAENNKKLIKEKLFNFLKTNKIFAQYHYILDIYDFFEKKIKFLRSIGIISKIA